MLQIQGITKKYFSDSFEQIALNNVSMNFRNSEFVSILGQSGSGKTTLLNIIGGLDQYTSGDLIINGISTKRFTDRDWDAYRNYSIGFVFQSYNLIGHQTILSNVEMALTLSGVKKAERKKRAIQALTNVGLADHINKKPNQLSGGQMQRVAIARALVNNPDIILADEPTGALDSDTSVQIMDILKNIARNKLVIMVTHNPELAEEYSTRIIRLKDGHVIGDTNPYSDAECVRDNNGAYPIIPDDANPGYMLLTKRTSPLDEFRLSEKTLSSGVSQQEMYRQPMQPLPTQNLSSPPPKKTSMNYLTALSLSLNNLMTKKGRTLLTSFAGSIGIIGIALILAISTGVNSYIDEIQHDAMGSYPIQIDKETSSMSAMFNDLMGSVSMTDTSGREDVYATPLLVDTLKSMSMGETKTNNLNAFKKYLDEHSDEVNEYALAVQYGYDIDLNVFAKDPNGTYSKADLEEIMGEAMGGDDSNSASTTTTLTSLGGIKIWQELLTDPTTGEISNLVADQYELVYGKWPTKENELILVLDQNSAISDLTLYSLGLLDKETMIASIVTALSGQKENETFGNLMEKHWSYEDICKIPLKMVLPTDYYQYDESLGLWTDISNNDIAFESVIEKGLELKVVGIIKPYPDVSSPPLTGSLCYTHALTQYYLEHVNESEMVKQQLSSENSNKNIISGLPFKATENTKDLTDAEKVTEFKNIVAGLTDIEKEKLYYNILSKPKDSEVQEAIDSVVKKYKEMTAEEIIDNLKKEYSEQLGYSADVVENMFKNYTKDELIDLLTKTAKESIEGSYQINADETINNLKNTPSDSELAELKEEISKELFKSVEELPTSQQDSAKFSIKIAYIAENWITTTGLSEDASLSYLYSLSSKEINDIFDKVLAVQATEIYRSYSHASSSSENAKKVARGLDEYLKTCKDEDIIYYYDQKMHIITSDLNYEELLDKMGYATLENPAFISLYPKDFDGKTGITNMIAEYNKTASEENQIEYSDVMEMLMSSVSAIVSAISVVLICFVSISLIVSSIMIGIITYISVLERTKEIGILRAVGASKNDISRVFNAETMIVGFLAGAVGIVSTILLCIPINLIARAVTNIDSFSAALPWYGYLLVALSMVLTLIAGLFPAMVAAKKDPVIALRTE